MAGRIKSFDSRLCACHPVTHNLLFSADYPYYVKMYFRQEADIIFTSGCSGDINPVERGDFHIAEKLGNRLAECIVRGMEIQIHEKAFGNAKINIESIKVEIPLAGEWCMGTVLLCHF